MARQQARAIELVGKRYVETVNSLTAQLRDANDLVVLYRKRIDARNLALERSSALLAKERSRAECAALIARWRVRLAEQRSLHLAERFAAQKAKSSLMRKIVLGWQKATGATWRRATEKRIRLGAEKALAQLSSDYEKRLRDISSTLAKTESRLAASENENLRAHDEMKKALMRGVCALNMEAMSVFRESSPVMFDNLLTVGVPAQQNKPPPQQMAAPAPAFNFLPVEPTHNVGDLTHQNPKQNRRTIPTPRSSFGPWGTDAPRVIRHVGKEGSYIASMEAGGRAKG